MKPRRHSHARSTNVMLEMHQHHRLGEIAGRRLEPNCQREELFVKALRAGHKVRARDYVLPALMYRVEQARMTQIDPLSNASAPQRKTSS